VVDQGGVGEPFGQGAVVGMARQLPFEGHAISGTRKQAEGRTTGWQQFAEVSDSTSPKGD
jgi:hypothetical protein